MAAQARFCRGLPHDRAGVGNFTDTMAGRTGDSRNGHATGMCLDGPRARALEHIHLLLVVVGVARGAIGSGVSDPLSVERMLNGQMARETVDLMVGDM